MSFIYEKQWQFLAKSVALGKLSHAYLFSGRPDTESPEYPRGIGKEKIALAFAELILCQGSGFKEKSCGVCSSCLEFKKNCHPDFLSVERPSEEDDENQMKLIRNLENWLALKPGLGGFRVAIINFLETFSMSAQSALLKTLEEPRGEAILIITSNYPELLPKTILSRTQEIRFYPAILAKPSEKEVADFRQMIQEGIAASFQKIKEISAKDKAEETVEKWLAICRFAFLDRPEPGNAKLKRFLSAGQKTYKLITTTNVNQRLALENLALEFLVP